MSWQALVIYAAGAFALWAIVTTLRGADRARAQHWEDHHEDRR